MAFDGVVCGTETLKIRRPHDYNAGVSELRTHTHARAHTHTQPHTHTHTHTQPHTHTHSHTHTHDNVGVSELLAIAAVHLHGS